MDSGSGGRAPWGMDEEITPIDDAYQVGLKLIEVDIEGSIEPEEEKP